MSRIAPTATKNLKALSGDSYKGKSRISELCDDIPNALPYSDPAIGASSSAKSPDKESLPRQTFHKLARLPTIAGFWHVKCLPQDLLNAMDLLDAMDTAIDSWFSHHSGHVVHVLQLQLHCGGICIINQAPNFVSTWKRTNVISFSMYELFALLKGYCPFLPPLLQIFDALMMYNTWNQFICQAFDPWRRWGRRDRGW